MNKNGPALANEHYFRLYETVKVTGRYCHHLFLFLLLLISSHMNAQDSVRLPLNKNRLALVAASEGALYAGSVVGEYQFWYKGFARSNFHFFNDNNEWMQMDKSGHIFVAYYGGKVGYELLKWTGLKENKCVWYGGLLGFAFLANVEILDGHSAEWGFSWGDFAANAFGSAAFISQQLAWKEQRFLIKYSYHNTAYAAYRPQLLGATSAERLMKDYNGHSIWISASPGTFMGAKSKFPKWLCFSVGYGAEGMTGGYSNPLFAEDGKAIPHFDRYRQFYFSMDVDLSKIPVKCVFLKKVLNTVNFIKVPFPALEYNCRSGFKGHWLYY
ncbi:MAG: DUF2279 domain-containing protein [Bacteroidota bacterium]